MDKFQLNIIIAGAGLAGIAAAISCTLGGHKVIVLESTKALAEIGAGLQITPNASRLLEQWQLPAKIWSDAAEPTKLTVHRYSGQVLAQDTVFSQRIRSRYGSPFIDLHRVDLHQALYTRAQDLGVVFHFNERIADINFETTTITTKSGSSFAGDLIVAADGLWSRCRECLLGVKDEPKPTGDLAYRIVLSSDELTDPALKSFIENPEVHFWIGPGSHVVSYSLRGAKMFNIVLLVPDDLPSEVSRQAGSVEEMKKLFVGWDPILTSFLDNVKSVDKWKLMYREELESWISPTSNMVLIGDSSHPMLPYLAQGANSSLEDGAALGTLLAKVTKKSQLPSILRTYEKVRKERGESTVREAFEQRKDFHMPDGPEQERRDALFLSQLGKELEGKFPSRWTCPEVQPWLYGYDAVGEAEKAYAESQQAA